MSRALDTIAVLMPLPQKALDRVRSAFKTVHYAPAGPDVPAKRLAPEVWKDVEVVFCDWAGPPKDLELSEVPKLRHVQLPTAGLDGALANSKLVQQLAEKGPSANAPTVSTASGIHVFTIPNWVVGMTITLSQQHHVMARFARVSFASFSHCLVFLATPPHGKQEAEKLADVSKRANSQEQKHWADEMEVGPVGKFYNRPLWGRTAGMLGYGALGRETARLLKAHGMRIIAANSSGKASKFEDWTPEGTGDLDGELLCWVLSAARLTYALCLHVAKQRGRVVGKEEGGGGRLNSFTLRGQ